jgi:hypothetical protein
VDIGERYTAFVRANSESLFGTALLLTGPVSGYPVPDVSDGVDPTVAVLDRALLWSLLSSLTANQRAAIVLRYFHDQPDADIAEALGRRSVTVRSLISRGLATMRADLRNCVDPHAEPEVLRTTPRRTDSPQPSTAVGAELLALAVLCGAMRCRVAHAGPACRSCARARHSSIHRAVLS